MSGWTSPAVGRATDDRRSGTRIAAQPVTAADGSVVEQRTEDRGIVQERLTVAGVRRDPHRFGEFVEGYRVVAVPESCEGSELVILDPVNRGDVDHLGLSVEHREGIVSGSDEESSEKEVLGHRGCAPFATLAPVAEGDLRGGQIGIQEGEAGLLKSDVVSEVAHHNESGWEEPGPVERCERRIVVTATVVDTGQQRVGIDVGGDLSESAKEIDHGRDETQCDIQLPSFVCNPRQRHRGHCSLRQVTEAMTLHDFTTARGQDLGLPEPSLPDGGPSLQPESHGLVVDHRVLQSEAEFVEPAQKVGTFGVSPR